MPDLSERIEDVAEGPASVSSDGATVAAHSLADLIEADKYLATKEAAAQVHRGMRFTKLRMPGARGREPGC